ncbi:MAG: hypothetical protein HQ582_06730 [Planctomycetes bacterium]|nr:hypothetical protein [Planctomycetota bacterium]
MLNASGWDDVDSHKWIAEPTWGGPIAVDWVEFDGRDCLRAGVAPSAADYSLMRTDAFLPEDWQGKASLRADVYQEGGAGGVDARLEVRGPTFDPWFQSIVHNDLQPNQWNTVTWDFDTTIPGYAAVSHLSIVFERFSGASPTFYVDNLRLVTADGEEEWDDMDDGSRQWFYFGNWINWGPATPFGLEPVTHLGANPTTPAGALYLQWDYDNGLFPGTSAEIGTSQLDDVPDWSPYNRISADVKVSDPDVPISVFFWDSDTGTGFGTPTRKAGVADTWRSLVWDIPWPPSFDKAGVDEIKFVVNTIDVHTTGTLFLDNIAITSATPLVPVGGLDYSFASFERESPITDFSSNWGKLTENEGPEAENDVTITSDNTTAAEGSRASLKLDYDLQDGNFGGLWFSLWGHSDNKETQSIDFTDVFGNLSGEDKDFEQIQFWVRGSGLTDRTHNVKVELKDATDQFDRTAFRYITVDDSDPAWQRVVLDADVTNGSFWSYNLDPPDPTDMKFLILVVEKSFNEFEGEPAGTFYVDNIQFVDADDAPFNPAQESDDAFLDLVSERTFLYFLDWYDPDTGLFHDRSEFPDLMSIAATGFGLTALTIGAQRGWIERQEAIDMITRTLETLRDGQSLNDSVEDAIADTNGYKGFYYHFLGNDGKRKDSGSELSSVDTAILLMGALTAKEHFANDSPHIVDLVDELYGRVDWGWMLDNSTSRFYHGWKPQLDGGYTIDAPGGGYFSGAAGGGPLEWDISTDEVMLISILAIASPTHSVPDDVFYAWERNVGTYAGHTLVQSWNGSLFTYFFAHLWIDFQPLGRDNPPPEGPIAVDWWENSVQATLANRQFAMDHADDQVYDGDDNYTTYGPNSFGLTACDGFDPDGPGPLSAYHAFGAPPTDPRTEPDHDGTIAPYGAGSAIMFTPNFAIDALKHYFAETEAWNYRLGLGDAFSLEFPDGDGPWYNRALFGIDNGPMLIAIENYRSGFVWETIRGNPEINEALTRLFAPQDLGPIDFVELEHLDPSAGDYSYRMTTSQAGYLTCQATYDTLGGTAELILYDSAGNPIDASATGSGTERVECEAGGPGEVYFLELTGTCDDVDLTLLNLVHHEDTTVSVSGTDGPDGFTFNASAPYRVTANGVVYQFNAPDLNVAIFDGFDGDDSFTYDGSADAEWTKMWPYHSRIKGPCTVVTRNTENATANSGGGDDVAQFFADSPQDEVFYESPVEAALYGGGGSFSNRATLYRYLHAYGSDGDTAIFDGSATGQDWYVGTPEFGQISGLRDDGANFFARANGFDKVTVNSGGGSDVAQLFDSPSDDVFIGTPTGARLSGPGYEHEVKLFDYVHTYASDDGQQDTAELNGSATGQDWFIATPDYGQLSGQRADGTNFFLRARSFDEVSADSRGGSDVAQLYDSPGEDEFTADPEMATLFGPGYHLEVKHFQWVHTYASDDGQDDTADLTGSATGQDWLIGTPEYGQLSGQRDDGSGFFIRGRGFRVLYATSGGGSDVAQLYDSSGEDELTAAPKTATLSGPGFELNVNLFDYVHTYASDDGQTDTATLTGSATGQDWLIATPLYGRLAGQRADGTDFFHRAVRFDQLTANSGGGSDVAQLHDSLGDDVLEAYPDTATMSYQDGTSAEAVGFHYLHGYASPGGFDTATLYDTTTDGLTSYTTKFTSDVRPNGSHRRRMTCNYGPYIGAMDFDNTRAVSKPGQDDVAVLHDSALSDTYEAYIDRATMTYEDGTVVRADNYRYTHGDSRNGGFDAATLYDTTADGQTSYTTKFTSKVLPNGRHRRWSTCDYGVYLGAMDFDNTRAVSTPGQSDVAIFYDSDQPDAFEAYVDRATMNYGGGKVVVAEDYRYTHAYSGNGGFDTATLYDQTVGGTSYATEFRCDATSSKLFTAGYGFFTRAVQFDELRAVLGGGNDQAFLFDDPALVDHLLVPFDGDFYDPPAKAKFFNSNRTIFIDDFFTLWAYTSQDFVDDKVIDPGYSGEVTLQGNWTDP